jgi:hypothetical protein
MGRPVRQLSPLPGRRLTVMNISCEPELKEGMLKIALSKKMTLSEFVRYLARDAYPELRNPGANVPAAKPVVAPVTRPGRKSPDDIIIF